MCLANLAGKTNHDVIINDKMPLHTKHIMSAFKSSGLTPLERHMVLAVFTGGIWTQERLEAYGQSDSAYCEFCGQSDTVEHRLWTCSHTEDLRSALPKWVRDKACGRECGDLKYTRLIAPNPARHVTTHSEDAGAM